MVDSLQSAIADVVSESLSLPGGGETGRRFRRLWEIAATDPSLGRLAEAHHDARAILQEADVTAPSGLLAVWAAGGPDPLTLEGTSTGWRLHGCKHWCSGAGLAKHALVTAECADAGSAIVLVDMCAAGVSIGPAGWRSPAFAEIDTRTVRFDCAIGNEEIVGTNDWYLQRPGFWHGAVGVAACWAGSIDGVIDQIGPWRSDPHALAHRGAVDALTWTMHSALDAAAGEIDADPIGTPSIRQRRALRVRHLVDTAVGEIADRTGRALGPGPMAHGTDIHRRLAEADLYRRQCHAERDLEVLGKLVIVPEPS